MLKYSIYTSCFNIEKNNFNYWQVTLPKWIEFIEKGQKGEIIIAINKSEDNTLEIIKKHFNNLDYIKIIETNYDYNDYAFDGKIKNEALQNTTSRICLGLDLDEYPSPNKNSWNIISDQFINSIYDSIFIPVIDLCKNKNLYKSIGCKWYIHKSGLYRGVWNGAKLDNGKIDIKKSDTCELLNKDGNLCSTAHIIEKLSVENIKKNNIPFIIHLGWLEWEIRQQQNKTWQPIWSNRAGYEVSDILHEKQSFDSIPVFPHNLNI
jgi:glycosyltransferase involved in cell wall biosynthesis